MYNMKENQGTYLTGKCLISTPCMEDERFSQSLIYICSHNKEGAMGFVINKKIKEFSFSDLASQLPVHIAKPVMAIDLHQGGPLEKVRGFVLHSTDYIKNDTIKIDNTIAISSSMDIITDIAYGNGPLHNLIALGYASWAPQQLEQEIIDNDWLVVDSSPELVFQTNDEDKWQKALDKSGIDLNRLCSRTGRA